MTERTPPLALFDDAYAQLSAPWIIGEPQPAILAIERDGLIRGRVLDAGCGTGEHTIALTRLGHDVVGVDFAPHAIELARANADDHGIEARFEQADALEFVGPPRFDTVLDSALFHVFDPADRVRYVESLSRVCRPAARVFVLALSPTEPQFGPSVTEADIRNAFAIGWEVESIEETTYGGIVNAAQTEALGLPAGARVDVPAWLARVRRR